MTDIQICNLALARLGDARITSLSDATAQAQYCSLFYTQTLEELQTEFDWQFCRKLASLTADATSPAFGYARRFAVPSDFLRLIRLNGIDEDENFSKWEIVDGFIHSDLAAPAQIEYIAHVTDTAKFPAVFVEILSAKLATNLAMPLTGSKDLFAQMADVFSANMQRPVVKALILATAKDRPSTALTEDELCRQAILRVGTAEQFGPSSQAMLLAKSLYPQVRDALLLAGSWTWAMKSTTVIETIPRPEYKWAYRYAIPADCLRVFRVNDYDSAGESSWEVAGNFVLTNADSGSPAWVVDRVYEVGNAVSNNGAVYKCMVAGSTKQPGVTTGWQSDWDIWLGSAITLEYVRKVTDVTAFDSLFIDLLTANLAAKLAVPLTGDANKASLLAKETELLGKNPAMRRDSTERKGKIKPAWMSSKLVSSRSGGDGIEASKATGGGPAGGISYPSLQVTVGTVTALSSGTPPFVTNTGQYETAVLNFGLPQGAAGTVQVGTTTTGDAGTDAKVDATGTPENQILNFTIPRGDQGAQGIQGIQGIQGPGGPANTLSVGTVITGAAGSSAGATITGTSPNQTLNLAIPKGDKGDGATIAVGTVTTGVAGSNAIVTNAGTTGDAVFNFTIPRGDAGLGNAFYSLTPPAAPSAGDLWWKTDTKQLFLFNGTSWTEINGNNDEYPVFDADADAYIAAVEAADGQSLEQAVKDAYTMFIVNAKLDGIWSDIKASCIMAGARTLAGALTPLAGVAPTNINFTPADYDRKTGLKGDASTKYLNTNRNQTADDKDNKHIAVYVTQDRTGDYGYFGGAGNITGSTFASYYQRVRMAISAYSTGDLGFTTLSAPSLLGASRSNSADFVARFNGASSTKVVASSASNQNANMNIFARHNADGKTNARMSFYSMGESIDLAKLESRVTTLMSQLNTAIL